MSKITVFKISQYVFALKRGNFRDYKCRKNTLCVNVLKTIIGAGSVAEWLSSWASFRRPRVPPVWILGVDMAQFIRTCWGGIQIAKPKGPTTRLYTYVLLGFGEKKEKKKRLATDVSSGTIFKKKRRRLATDVSSGTIFKK